MCVFVPIEGQVEAAVIGSGSTLLYPGEKGREMNRRSVSRQDFKHYSISEKRKERRTLCLNAA